MEPRSSGATPEPSRRPLYTTARPPRFGAAATDGRSLMTVEVVKGPTGFGFTLADTEHGQVIKEVVDSERCRHVFPGDVLVAINDVTVVHWSHDDVVSMLRRCRCRRVAKFTLSTSRDDDARRDPVAPPVRRDPSRPVTAMASPLSADGQTDPPRHVDYNQLYRRMYSPVPFVSVSTPETAQARSADIRRGAAFTHAVTSNGEPEVVLTSRYSAPPTVDAVGGSPAPRRIGPGRRREPRRSLPAQPVTSVDLLSPLIPRRMSRESSQTSLNFSGTPDFIPASAYLEDDDRRRRATGRPTVDHELAALTLSDPAWSRGNEVFSSSATNNRENSIHSYDTDDASLPSSGSLPNGLPVKSPTTSGYYNCRTPAAFVGAGNETCNGYNARTEALHSAAPVRHHPPSEHRQRSQSVLADAVGPGRGTHRGPEVDDYDRPPVTLMVKSGSLDRRNGKASVTLTEPAQGLHSVSAISSSSGVNSDLSEAARSSGVTSSTLYEVELHRGSRGFGFAIRGGREFAGMPICVLNIASGGSADRDGRLRSEDEVMSINRVPTEGMTHADAVQLIQNSPSPLHLLMRQMAPTQSSEQPLNHTTGRVARRYVRSPTKGARQTAASPTRPAAAVVSTPPIYRRPTPAS